MPVILSNSASPAVLMFIRLEEVVVAGVAVGAGVTSVIDGLGVTIGDGDTK